MNKTGLGTEYSILPTVTHMLHVYQVCMSQCRRRLLWQNMSRSSSSLGVKVSGQYCWDIVDKC